MELLEEEPPSRECLRHYSNIAHPCSALRAVSMSDGVVGLRVPLFVHGAESCLGANLLDTVVREEIKDMAVYPDSGHRVGVKPYSCLSEQYCLWRLQWCELGSVRVSDPGSSATVAEPRYLYWPRPLPLGGKGYHRWPKERKKQRPSTRRWFPVGLTPKRAKLPGKGAVLDMLSLAMT